MDRYCDGLPLADCGLFHPIQSPVRPETIYGNCLVLIVLPLMVCFQQWRGLAGIQDRQKKADIYNIYEGKELIPVCDPVMMGSGHARA
ncbi:hypothetical protein ACK30K_07850 [Aeromonas caviae]